MKRIAVISLIVVMLLSVAGSAHGSTWYEYADEIVSNAEAQIRVYREAYAKNGGLEITDAEALYRYYMLWISAVQVRNMARKGFESLVILEGSDPYATSQRAAAERWQQYLKGEISEEKFTGFIVGMTDAIEK